MSVINIVIIYCCLTSFLSFGIKGIPLKRGYTTNHIIFPEHRENVATAPECSNNRTFCEDVEFYPEEKFHAILKNSAYVQEYFISQDEYDISDRFHPDRENHICGSRTVTSYPRVARNSKNQWKFIYNFDKYTQRITTEECDSETSCTRLQNFPRGIKTKCVQHYSEALLLIVEDGRPDWDKFYFPSACRCSYQYIVNINFT